MRKKLISRKPFIVDGQAYEASLAASYDKVVNLRLTIRACFGNRSFCIMSGLRNFDYFYNYGHWNVGDNAESANTVSITPRMIAALIRNARRTGWSPDVSKSNYLINITNPEAKSILDKYAALASETAPE